eukprot:TRINITY_DN3966_c1_g1_i1.p1 TRINITY_DN3966_c1_g1~~TRINITY_DN3966_c1_g1_i1.p1  ORF type:complete len:300 (-),score=78.85 TRINITY_DN3966_c1_g1_i1:21-872(-)
MLGQRSCFGSLVTGFLVFMFASSLWTVEATLPFEGDWQQVAIASFFGTSVNSFSGALQVPEPPLDTTNFFAIVAKLESITVTEGIATIIAWNTTLNNYTLQLYYTTNGVDQTFSNVVLLKSGANITFFESYDYDNEAWTVGANVTGTEDNLFLSFPEDLTLSQASIELSALEPGQCNQLPASNSVKVTSVGYNCGFVGCGPWVPNTWEACGVLVDAHGAVASFSFNSSSSSVADANETNNFNDKMQQISSVAEDQIVVMKEKIIEGQRVAHNEHKQKRRVKRN